MTVLANEQGDRPARAGALGAPVERRELTQWFFRVSDLFRVELRWPRSTGQAVA